MVRVIRQPKKGELMQKHTANYLWTLFTSVLQWQSRAGSGGGAAAASREHKCIIVGTLLPLPSN